MKEELTSDNVVEWLQLRSYTVGSDSAPWPVDASDIVDGLISEVNKLSAQIEGLKSRQAEIERLAMLVEECGEVVQAGCKAIRHGLDSYHPNDPDRRTNREHLDQELLDVSGVRYGMTQIGDLPPLSSVYSQQLRWNAKQRYTHHQKMDR